ncbi:hypothetical protein AGMMS49940_12220 [Spirochaetia bacterium]|nr:hypothetical protein AGMMS49940_12220 [Spirochaetia bacterium]
MEHVNLQEKIIIAVNVAKKAAVDDAYKDLIRDFTDAVIAVETCINNPKYVHPFERVIEKSGIMNAIAGSNALVHDWRRKFNNLPCIMLVDIKRPDSSDPFAFFFNSDDFENRMAGYRADRAEVTTMAAFAEKNRFAHPSSHRVFSGICVLSGPVIRVSAKKNLDPKILMEIVLWHEFGHLIFNPDLCAVYRDDKNLGEQEPDALLYTPAPKKNSAKPYPCSKPLMFMIEGAAEWFAFNAEDWGNKSPGHNAAKNYLFAKRRNESEYSYYLDLDCYVQNIPLPIANLLLAFYFNCVRSALTYMLFSPNRIEPKDYQGAPWQGRNCGPEWSSYPNYILHGINGRRIALNDFLTIGNKTRDLIDACYADSSVFTQAGFTHPCNPPQISALPPQDPQNGYAKSSGGKSTDFDDYFRLPASSHVNGDESGSTPFLVGMTGIATRSRFLCISKTKTENEEAYAILLNAAPAGREDIICGAGTLGTIYPYKEAQWSAKQLRGAFYNMWFNSNAAFTINNAAQDQLTANVFNWANLINTFAAIVDKTGNDTVK